MASLTMEKAKSIVRMVACWVLPPALWIESTVAITLMISYSSASPKPLPKAMVHWIIATWVFLSVIEGACLVFLLYLRIKASEVSSSTARPTFPRPPPPFGAMRQEPDLDQGQTNEAVTNPSIQRTPPLYEGHGEATNQHFEAFVPGDLRRGAGRFWEDRVEVALVKVEILLSGGRRTDTLGWRIKNRDGFCWMQLERGGPSTTQRLRANSVA